MCAFGNLHNSLPALTSLQRQPTAPLNAWLARGLAMMCIMMFWDLPQDDVPAATPDEQPAAAAANAEPAAVGADEELARQRMQQWLPSDGGALAAAAREIQTGGALTLKLTLPLTALKLIPIPTSPPTML